MGARKTRTGKPEQGEEPILGTQPAQLETFADTLQESSATASIEGGSEGAMLGGGLADPGIEVGDRPEEHGELGCPCAAAGYEEGDAGPTAPMEACFGEDRRCEEAPAGAAGALPHPCDDSGADEVGSADVGEIGGDDAVVQAQESLGACWQEGGRAVFTCPQDEDDELDEDGDLGRFDIHDPHQLGELGEHIAARYLRMYDYKILERNYRCGQGEADIICTKDDSVVLVEVKTRLGGEARPEEAVDASKLRRYKRITLQYLMSHEWFESVRLDVLAVNIVEEHRAQVHHFMGVCAWEG